MRNCVVVAALAGCGRIGFDPVPGTAADAPTDCWASWLAHTPSFTTVNEIVELGFDQPQNNPSLAPDDLHLFFGRHNATSGFIDLFFTQRAALNQPWASPSPVSSLNGMFDNGRLTLAGDERTAVFASTRGGSTALWVTSRATATSAFAAPSQGMLAQLNVFDREFDPDLTADGSRLYFSPAHPDDTQYLMVSDGTPGGFGAPRELTELEITNSCGDPSFSPDQRVVVFSVAPAPASTNDLFYATRADPAAPFDAPMPVPQVNMAGTNEVDSSLAHDGCELLFTTDRQGRNKLYFATMR